MLELFQSIKNGSIDLGTWVFPEKLRDLPITVSVGKSKTEAFDNVMANMNVVQTVSLFGHYVRFNLVEDKDQKRSTACEMRERRILALNLVRPKGMHLKF